MTRQPSNAGRTRCLSYLENLLTNPPDGFYRLDIIRTHRGGEQTSATFTMTELGDDPESLFEEHLADYADQLGRLQYRCKVRDEDGVVVPGPSAAWGLKRVPQDAASARTAGGGAEVATATLSRVQGEAFKQTVGMLPSLAAQAAGASSDQLEQIMASHERALEDRTEGLYQMMELQGALVEAKTELALRQQASFFDTAAGTSVVGVAVQAATELIPALAEGIRVRNEAARLENLRAEARLVSAGVVTDEPDESQHEAAPENGSG